MLKIAALTVLLILMLLKKEATLHFAAASAACSLKSALLLPSLWPRTRVSLLTNTKFTSHKVNVPTCPHRLGKAFFQAHSWCPNQLPLRQFCPVHSCPSGSPTFPLNANVCSNVNVFYFWFSIKWGGGGICTLKFLLKCSTTRSPSTFVSGSPKTT